MKKLNLWWFLVLIGIGAGAVLYVDDRREAQHKQEYVTHVARAISYVGMAELEAQQILDRWEESTPFEVLNSMLSISSSLHAAEVESDSLGGYLRYHDDLNWGGSSTFISYLFKFYKDVVDRRFRESWQYGHLSNLNGDEAVYWGSIRQDLTVLQRDLHHLASVDSKVFEENDRSKLYQFWIDWTSTLQFREPHERYQQMYSMTP
ncbi:hypothetical protein CIG75_00595 [Tumebacillus algifaecis]|uniref:Uncharacterized protein n=1 Tax=Tumebacillus algifaecis TaxID=1214604 RepID=A0A223CWF1_9BACL|nr:hypothetical protein [Tumebacillus algifaecis]ASS73621.1 hypothetical protein CIG75_00595 [Tumebacillus algifaecis]